MGRLWQRLIHRVRLYLILRGLKLPGLDIERVERDWERSYQQVRHDGDRVIRAESRVLRDRGGRS